MILEGPTLSNPIPAGSVIVCANLDCRAHIYITMRGIRSGDKVTDTTFVALVKKPTTLLCPVCKRSFITEGSRVRYIAPPKTLGDRIIHFMAWDETEWSSKARH